MKAWRAMVTAIATALVLAGCASHEPVPVLERSPATAAAEPTVKAGTPVPVGGEAQALYTVKKGDTLYSIALEHGQDYRDVAAWNAIDNPNRIQVGQQLRLAPPEGGTQVVVVKPVTSAAPVEVKTSGTNSETYKREPRGGKLPYSEQALAKMRESGVAPTAEPAEKAAEKPAEKPAVAASGDDAIDWTWPAAGKTLAGFTEGIAGKESSKGIDVAGKAGDAVLAAADGIVSYVGSGLRGYGNLVVVRHNATYLTVYAHNSRILVKEKQSVAKGQKIAEIGNSDADQVKLHFEIRRLGKPVDPSKYLPAR